jgi:cytochrome c-type biogenesis protein CcmH/NrfG
LLLALGVAALTIVAFLPSLDGQFLNWDDGKNLVTNEGFRGLGWSNVRWMATTTLMGHWMPLTWLTLGMNYVLGGMAPWGYHAGNELLHAANAVVFFAVARRLLAAGAGLPRTAAMVGWGAAAAAAVFAVHPLRVESVAWATERRDVLSGLLFLLAVLGYLKAVEQGQAGRLDGRWRAVSLGLFAAALMSKASTMMLPAALLVLDVYPLRRQGVSWAARVREKSGYLVLAGAGAVVALVAVRQGATVTGYGEYGIGARAVMTVYSLMFYPWKFLWPVDLSPMYELPARIEPGAWKFVVPLVAVPLITAGLIALRRWWPGGLAAWGYSALLVLPVSGAVHAGYQLAHDRYSYLSGLGFALLVGGVVVWVMRAGARGVWRPWLTGVGLATVVLVVAGLAAGSWRQSRVWHDSETLWRRAASTDPSCMLCQNNLGNLLLDQDRLGEAEAAFRAAISARPDSAGPRNNLGAVLLRSGRLDEAAAQFREASRLAPERIGGALNLGLLQVMQGDYAGAIPTLRHVLAQRPDRRDAQAALAIALARRAAELRLEGRPDEADGLARESESLLRKSR